MLSENFAFLAALLNLWSTAVYAIATLRGETQPNRVTWLMWGLAPLLAATAQWAGGVGLSTLFVLAAGLGPLLIFICSFVNKKAYWKTTPFDYGCGGLALCGLAGWYVTRNENFAIVFSILGDFFAALPTLRKAYTDPWSENGPTYLLGVLSVIVAILSIQQRSFTAYAFTLYVLILCSAICVIIYGRRRILPKRAS